MKRLYILRHAKAAPGEPGQDDHAPRADVARRSPMPKRWRATCARTARGTDRVLVSTSARTVQTADLVLRELEMPPRADYRDTLYLAGAGKILAMLQAAPAKRRSRSWWSGHNPGLEELATLLAREPVRRKERERRDVLEEKFPTGALAVLDFDIARWRDLQPGEGKLVDFVRPKDL